MKVLKGKILVKPIAHEKEINGIIVLEASTRSKGHVVVAHEETEFGDLVWYDNRHGVEVKVDGETYFVMDEKNVLYIE